METHLPEAFRQTPAGREAEAILRACVHCGFCTATCPTYQLTGDEDDGPRGRIYLIKQALETGRAGPLTRAHLDRCLTCRACETTCPSGVRYHHLLEIARPRVRAQASEPLGRRLLRRALVHTLPERRRAHALFAAGRLLRPLLPARLAHHLPSAGPAPLPAPGHHARRVVLFQGCVEPAALPSARAAAVRLLDHLGIAAETVPGETCCGALEHHLDATDRARARARNNLKRWQAALEGGTEAIVGLSSACVLQIREYPELLADEPRWRDIAEAVAPRCVELGRFLADQDLPAPPDTPRATLAWHPPCTLQHGLRDADTIPRLLQRLGYRVLLPAEAHLCCGAAGAYTLFQPELSQRLGEAKRAALEVLEPEAIVTANVGCLLHLQRPQGPPVRHWVEAALAALVE